MILASLLLKTYIQFEVIERSESALETSEMYGNRKASPLFSYFLNAKAFLILYALGFSVFLGWIYVVLSFGDSADILTSVLMLSIYTFLGPSVYIFLKGIFKEFETLFKKPSPKATKWSRRTGFSVTEEFGGLFSNEKEFNHYRHGILRMLYDTRAKYLSIGIALCLLLPVNISQDLQQGPLKSALSGPMFLPSAIAYSFWILYWAAIYSLLLSVVWMIIAITRALLNLEKEKPHLHVTQSLSALHESCKNETNEALQSARLDLLDASFRRFRAGLSPITNFALSLSLKIAFVGGFFSVPALVYFLITQRVHATWYSLCVFSGLLSIAVFVVSQHAVSRLWAVSKKDANRFLDQVCREITEDNEEPTEGKVKTVTSVRKLSTDLNQLSAITYTSSSLFKVISVNFLAFGPLLIEQTLIRFVFK